MSKKYKITIDRESCIGDASCVEICPKLFKMDDQLKSVFTQGGSEIITDNLDPSLDTAAQSCPVAAIKIIEIDSQGKPIKQYWPPQ